MMLVKEAGVKGFIFYGSSCVKCPFHANLETEHRFAVVKDWGIDYRLKQKMGLSHNFKQKVLQKNLIKQSFSLKLYFPFPFATVERFDWGRWNNQGS